MRGEAMGEAPVAFAGGHAQFPAARAQAVEQRADAVKQRFGQPSLGPRGAKRLFVAINQRVVEHRLDPWGQPTHRLRQAEANNAADQRALGQGKAKPGKGGFHRLANIRLAIDQRAIAIEHGEFDRAHVVSPGFGPRRISEACSRRPLVRPSGVQQSGAQMNAGPRSGRQQACPSRAEHRARCAWPPPGVIQSCQPVRVCQQVWGRCGCLA